MSRTYGWLFQVFGLLSLLCLMQARADAQAEGAPTSPSKPARAEPPRDTERPPDHAPRIQLVQRRRHQHEGGFARFTLGGAYTVVTAALPSGFPFDEVALRGAGVEFGGDIGGALAPNLILHARYMLELIPEPNVAADGGTERDSQGTLITAWALAPAVTFYFMPANVYLTASAGLAKLTLDQQFGDQMLRASTDFGLWLNADLGVEGWVSADWSLGIAARARYATLPSSDGTHVDSASVGLVVSASGALF